jgi:His/Glu/Gln/Arg/opine family amino acid ABC transporter permease subunit
MRLGDLFRFQLFLDFLPPLIRTVPVVLLITTVAFIFGLMLGLIAALITIRKVPFLRHLVSVYISFFRGTPLLVQLFIAYFGFPVLIREINISFGYSIDVRSISAIYYALVVFSLNTGAYLTETVRSALEAVDKGQHEAAKSIGMTNWQMMRRIVLPQAFLVALPNLGNTIIALVKDTSLAFTITIVEILNRARWLAAEHARVFEAYIGAAVIYWVICLTVEFLANILEKWSKRRRGLDDDVKRHT